MIGDNQKKTKQSKYRNYGYNNVSGICAR